MSNKRSKPLAVITIGNLRKWIPIVVALVTIVYSLSGCDEPTVERPRPTQPPEPAQPAPPTEAPAQLPDLIISDIKVDPKPGVENGYAVLVRGTAYAFTFEVSNVGKGTIQGNVAVSIDHGCQGPGVGQSGASVIALGPIPPGETRLTTSDNPFTLTIPANKDPGTCKFIFKVDPGNIYPESNEGNNTWETTVIVS